LSLLFDTVVIALLGTVFGAVGAGALCFAAARNMHRNPLAGFTARRLFELGRAVPDVVYALIFVYAFGLGAMSGALALAVHSFGALGKLFSEVVENVDPRSVEGVRATGARWPQEIRYGVLPQVLPDFASYTLLRFEINIRSASVVGFVGAGGIGQELLQVVRQFILRDVSAIALLIIATVMVADVVSERLRHTLIRGEVLP
jgi:phosphonate transport system permease protein